MRISGLPTFVVLFIATFSYAQTTTQSTTPSSPPQSNAPATQNQAQPCNCPCANQAANPSQNSTDMAHPADSNAASQNLGIGSNTQANPTNNAQSPTAPAPLPQTSSEPVPQPSSNTQESPALGTRQPPPTRIPMSRTAPVGAEVDATLDTPLSSKTSQVGQAFTATLAQPLRNNNGEVLIPIGSKVRGQVGSVEAGKTLPSIRGKGQLTLRFTDVVLSDGTSVPLVASLLGVTESKGGKQTASTSEEGTITGKNSGTTAAKDVGIGAGIGTVAGLIFGGALKGLAIGVLAGGGYVLANGGKDVELPADTGLRIRLDQNLTIPAR